MLLVQYLTENNVVVYPINNLLIDSYCLWLYSFEILSLNELLFPAEELHAVLYKEFKFAEDLVTLLIVVPLCIQVVREHDAVVLTVCLDLQAVGLQVPQELLVVAGILELVRIVLNLIRRRTEQV